MTIAQYACTHLSKTPGTLPKGSKTYPTLSPSASLFLALVAAILVPSTLAAQNTYDIDYGLEATVEVSLENKGTVAEVDTAPSRGSPRFDVEAWAARMTRHGNGFSSGPRLDFAFDIKGDWFPLALHDKDGVLLADEARMYAWALSRFSWDGTLAYGWKSGKNYGNWELELGLVTTGALNDKNKDQVIELGEKSLDVYTHDSLGLGITWDQTLGSDLSLRYKPEFALLFQAGSPDAYVRAALPLELAMNYSGGSVEVLGKVSLDKTFEPEFGMDFGLRWISESNDFAIATDLVRYEYDALWPELDGSKALGQQAIWSSAIEMTWDGPGWTLALGLEQPWWSLNRTQVNQVEDKPFTISFTYGIGKKTKVEPEIDEEQSE